MRRLAGMLVLAGVVPVTATAGSGLEPRTVPGYGISLELPASWAGSPAPASAASIGVRYIFRAPDAVGGFHANVNLLVDRLPAGMTLRQWFFSGASAAFRYAGTTRTVTIHGMRGLHYLSTRALRFGTEALLTDTYGFVRARRVYLITYTALAKTRSRYQGLFDASGGSIRFS